MALKPLEPEAIEKSQTELKEKLLSGSNVPQANVETVRTLMEIGRFEWPEGSGNWYSVPVVPYTEGLQLKEMYQRLAMSKEDTEAGIGYRIYENIINEMLDICWSLCIPERRWMKVLKRVWPGKNPFKGMASEGDIGVLLSFFIVRRMKSSVRFPYPAI